MAAGKQFEVIVEFRETNELNGKNTFYKVGDPYDGPYVEKCLKGVDDKGPLIRDRVNSVTTTIPAAADGTSSSSKEK